VRVRQHVAERHADHGQPALGGLLLVGVALRLLRIREIPVADLLPALLVAPLLVELAAAIH